jgi:AcrR family transcriptional regulator
MATENTKSKILAAALQLFNKQGTEQVTTNHIAAAAGISPGNLYYHYHNKEEIIRALVQERLFPALNEIWSANQGEGPALAGLRTLLHRHYEVLWAYRFFREVLSLTRRDPALGELYGQIHALRTQQAHALINHFVAAGVLKVAEPAVYADLVTTSWVITTYWLSYLETIGEPVDARQMRRGAELILRLFGPYVVERST